MLFGFILHRILDWSEQSLDISIIPQNVEKLIRFIYNSVVQPCRHSPHVAKSYLNVPTDRCSEMKL
jgi:hypothetical protein